MRRILIVGAGQSGLQLALALQAKGYDVTLMSHRTPDEIRTGRVMSTQIMFRTALQHERDCGLDFWEGVVPRVEGLGLSVAGDTAAGPRRLVGWTGRLRGRAQSVDQRLKMAGWLETFTERGGRLVIHAATVGDLDFLAHRYDLTLVAAGKGELVSLFARDPARSPYATPQRSLALVYVHGLGPCPEHPEAETARCTLVPGAGELWVIPTLTTSGRADILFWEGLPGGPLDVFHGVDGPGEHLARTLELLERYAPWEYGRATEVEPTDAGATLTGRYAPAVRDPVGRLPSGALVLGAADAVVVNDPLTGQGANSAAKCAAAYLAAILERGDGPFDEAWMRAAFARYWESARHATRWTNTMLAPPPGHVRRLIDAAGVLQPVADRFANGFDDPADFEDWFYDAARAEEYLAHVAAHCSGASAGARDGTAGGTARGR
ncbi:styrene monooxygenase/indole monooxygenase family protein [Streptomyces sp. NPDC049577]|uniref:styrene monooxygenase/indole monooxygenase family protein n=1 Tax=Streptomyces sp. NPDC049577 TaxID=3155153 RepID=UPI00343F78BE